MAVNIINKELLKNCLTDYQKLKPTYEEIYSYYCGITNAQKNYKILANKSNNKVSVNMMKKMIKQETAYVVGNKLTYISNSGNKKIIKSINDNVAHWSEKHDQDLLRNALTFGSSYELYFINNKNLFSSVILTPLDSYVHQDENGNIICVLRFFKKKFDDEIYCDVYTQTDIQHYKVSGQDFAKVKASDKHAFAFANEVPVSLCPISKELYLDTIWNDIKGLVDAYETNLSDITNELSDFRNAMLKIIGGKIKEEDLPRLKEMGLLQADSSSTSIDWLIKNINDAFISSTLNRLQSNMFMVTGHIDTNEKLQSNTSSLTLRTKLIELESRCALNADALIDCIKNRLRFLFMWLDSLQVKPTGYSVTDIKIRYSPMIPQDDLASAQVFSQVPDLFSKKTARSQFSFCDNPDAEEKQYDKEQESLRIGNNLLNGTENNTDNNGADTSDEQQQ